MKSIWHQAKEGKPCTAYTTALNMKAAFSPNALISLTNHNFCNQGKLSEGKKKKQMTIQHRPQPLFIFVNAPK